MPETMEQRYQERLKRYVTALRNGKPDMVPIRPFAAEFVGTYAGYTCQELAHDYNIAFEATRKCAADFDWDAVVGNMVYVWTGLTQAIGLKYYGVPGIDVPEDAGFQYREPPVEQAWMRPGDYDALIEDPTAYLYNTWLPRVTRDVRGPGQEASYRGNLALVRGGMAMLQYFVAFGEQDARLRSESGTPPAIAGILKAPLDILADKLRGYIGLVEDLLVRPDKVLAACEALAPHLAHVAMTSAGPSKTVPIGFWMHRSCVPFISHEHFNRYGWPTLKPMIQELWRNGYQTLFYAEGNWDAHLASFAELPDQSIVFHLDRTDPLKAHKQLGHKFCLSGGVPNYLLAYGTPDEVRAATRRIISSVAADGGYIMDASAIIQNDAKVENIRAMTEAAREYGIYSQRGDTPAAVEPVSAGPGGLPCKTKTPPGLCIPWEQERAELPPVRSREDLVKSVWENIDALAYTFIYQCLVSF
jgi:hypothetical protein